MIKEFIVLNVEEVLAGPRIGLSLQHLGNDYLLICLMYRWTTNSDTRVISDLICETSISVGQIIDQQQNMNLLKVSNWPFDYSNCNQLLI